MSKMEVHNFLLVCSFQGKMCQYAIKDNKKQDYNVLCTYLYNLYICIIQDARSTKHKKKNQNLFGGD
jgi:hypothetical protein